MCELTDKSKEKYTRLLKNHFTFDPLIQSVIQSIKDW